MKTMIMKIIIIIIIIIDIILLLHRDFFSSTDMFYPGNKFICAGATLTQTWLSISNLCQIKRLPHKNHRLDFHTIYNKWLPAYNLYIHQNLCRLNECM